MNQFADFTISQLLHRNAKEHPDTTAIIFEDRKMSFVELNNAAGAFASGLIKLGLRKGDKVGLWMQNYPEWVVAWFGITRAGGVVIPLDYWYKASEAEYILGHSDSVACVTAESFGKIKFLDMLEAVNNRLPFLENIIAVPNWLQGTHHNPDILSFHAVTRFGRHWQNDTELRKRELENSPEDVAFILYTSGTTGKPKGAQLTHRNICVNAGEVVNVLKLGQEDNLMVPVPFSHCFGCVLGITVATAAGCAVTPMLTFDPREALRLIQEHNVTVTHGVPTMFIRMLEVLEKEDFSSESLRTGIMAGAPCPEDTMTGVIEKMGCNICIGYGLTEASPIITMTRHEDPFEKRVTTVGKPIPDVEVSIVDDDNNPLQVGEMGELCCRGPNVFAGYYKDPVKTKEAIDGGNWLHSGDLAVEDKDGFFAIVGRKKDMIIVGGFNVYPREIEEYLITFPEISNIAIVGVPDHDLGELVFAMVEPTPDSGLTAQDVVDLCYGKMASAKVPRFVSLEGNIPVSGRGKVQKFKLRTELSERIKKGEFKKMVPSAVKKGKK